MRAFACLRPALRWFAFLCILIAPPCAAATEVIKITELIPQPGGGAAKAVWQASEAAAGPERASAAQVSAASEWARWLPSPITTTRQPWPDGPGRQALFKVTCPDKVSPDQKAGGLAVAMLAAGRENKLPLKNPEFVVCGEMSRDGVVTSTPEVRKLLTDFASNPLPGVTCLIVPADCSSIIRNSVAAGKMTFVTDCVVWTLSDAKDAVGILNLLPEKLQPAIKQYLARKPDILRKKEKWRSDAAPAARLSGVINPNGDRRTVSPASSFTPGVCLTLNEWILPGPVGLVESVLWDEAAVSAVGQATGGGDDRVWELIKTSSLSNGGSKPLTMKGKFAGLEFRGPGEYRLILQPPRQKERVPSLNFMDFHYCVPGDQILLWQSLFEKSGVFQQLNKQGQPVSRKLLPLDPSKFENSKSSTTKAMLTMICHLLWWDSEGLIEIAKGKTPDEKARMLSTALTKTNYQLSDAQPLPADTSCFGEGAFKGDVGFGHFKFWRVTPELLAAFTRGPVAASLRFSEYGGNKLEHHHTVPIVSATPDGRVEFIHEGKIWSGKLVPWKPTEKDKNKSLSSVDPGSTWRIDLERSSNPPAKFINGKSEFRITGTGSGSAYGDGLTIWWVDSPLVKPPVQ
jgi:hypothetical protein